MKSKSKRRKVDKSRRVLKIESQQSRLCELLRLEVIEHLQPSSLVELGEANRKVSGGRFNNDILEIGGSLGKEEVSKLVFPEPGVLLRGNEGEEYRELLKNLIEKQLKFHNCKQLVEKYWNPGNSTSLYPTAEPPTLKVEIVEWIFYTLLGQASPGIKRRIEQEGISESGFNDQLMFFTLCGVDIPLDVIRIVFRFLPQNRLLLDTVGCVNSRFYLLCLKLWRKISIYRSDKPQRLVDTEKTTSMSRINAPVPPPNFFLQHMLEKKEKMKGNLLKIPLLVLQSVKVVHFDVSYEKVDGPAKTVVIQELGYMLRNIHSVKMFVVLGTFNDLFSVMESEHLPLKAEIIEIRSFKRKSFSFFLQRFLSMGERAGPRRQGQQNQRNETINFSLPEAELLPNLTTLSLPTFHDYIHVDYSSSYESIREIILQNRFNYVHFALPEFFPRLGKLTEVRIDSGVLNEEGYRILGKIPLLKKLKLHFERANNDFSLLSKYVYSGQNKDRLEVIHLVLQNVFAEYRETRQEEREQGDNIDAFQMFLFSRNVKRVKKKFVFFKGIEQLTGIKKVLLEIFFDDNGLMHSTSGIEEYYDLGFNFSFLPLLSGMEVFAVRVVTFCEDITGLEKCLRAMKPSFDERIEYIAQIEKSKWVVEEVPDIT